MMKNGTRLQSQVCDTQVIVVAKHVKEAGPVPAGD